MLGYLLPPAHGTVRKGINIILLIVFHISWKWILDAAWLGYSPKRIDSWLLHSWSCYAWSCQQGKNGIISVVFVAVDAKPVCAFRLYHKLPFMIAVFKVETLVVKETFQVALGGCSLSGFSSLSFTSRYATDCNWSPYWTFLHIQRAKVSIAPFDSSILCINTLNSHFVVRRWIWDSIDTGKRT